MVEPAHHRLSISAQCHLLSISRSSYCYALVPDTDETLALMTVIDATFLDCPWYGSRRISAFALTAPPAGLSEIIVT